MSLNLSAENGQDKLVIRIIGNEQWPRACLRAELIERGYAALGFERLFHALSELNRAVMKKAQIIVLELRGQKITGHVDSKEYL